jgi:hypothetical protein
MSSSLVLGTLIAMIANLLLFHRQCGLVEKGPNPTKTLLANPNQETSAPQRLSHGVNHDPTPVK